LTPEMDTVRLMCYRSFGWPIHEENKKIENKKDSIFMVTGTICDNQSPHFKQFRSDRIIDVCILFENVLEEKVKMFIVV